MKILRAQWKKVALQLGGARQRPLKEGDGALAVRVRTLSELVPELEAQPARASERGQPRTQRTTTERIDVGSLNSVTVFL